MTYKELMLPQKLQLESNTLSSFYGKFVAEPYEGGYGHTVGNALRRVLLSSLEVAAVTAVRVEGAPHEYSTLNGVREDVMQILLNLKRLKLKMFTNGPEMLYLSVKKEGPVKASQIQPNPNVEMANGDLVIAHLEAGGKIDLEIEVAKGRGYVPAEELREHAHWPAGFLPVDAIFSPVIKVHYDVENARLGQVTNYDRLVLEVWTDGTLHPRDAVIMSAKLVRESLNLFIPEEEIQPQAPAYSPEGEGVAGDGGLPEGTVAGDSKLHEILKQPVEMIELSSRASNCLKVANIRTIRELVSRRDEELLSVKNFGKKSLTEIKERLKDMGLSLGMQL